MGNPYRGEVEISFNGITTLLVFDWQAIAALQTEFGETWYAQLPEKLGKDLEFTAKIVAIGLRRDMPDVTPAMVIVVSPPMIPTMRAVMRAVNLATFGEEAPKPEGAPDPPQPPSAGTS